MAFILVILTFFRSRVLDEDDVKRFGQQDLLGIRSQYRTTTIDQRFMNSLRREEAQRQERIRKRRIMREEDDIDSEDSELHKFSSSGHIIPRARASKARTPRRQSRTS